MAEVKHLRDRLMKSEYIEMLRQMLHKTSGEIEIPYNAAGVLVHLLSDAECNWTTQGNLNLKEELIKDLEDAIDKWEINSERSINYRSFEPIFRLVNNYETPICQRWSCWALANLTTVYRKALKRVK